MLQREQVVRKVQDFKTKHGLLDEQDENVVATLHMMHSHGFDLHTSQDQTSRGGNDHGIDAWHFDPASATLTLYQSKLTTAKATALRGFDELLKACLWLAELLRTKELDVPATNTGIYNLARSLATTHDLVKHVRCILISPFDANELDDDEEFAIARTDLAKSSLFSLLKDRGGSLDVRAEQYTLSGGVLAPPASYVVTVKDDTLLCLTDRRVHLRVVLLSLYSMIELFRRRGNLIFEKNVRLYLHTKKSKAQLEHPMEETLDQICSGGLEPNMFPFYHVGVTLSATGCESHDGTMSLDAPFIINGCQTVNIASRYLQRLEKAKAIEKIERLKAIQVVAKIVTRASIAQLREIANCNNRQNPIETWQLFSNDPIHVEIEASLRDLGIFYERQKGKFEADIVKLQALKDYPHTNGTPVSVVGLGQVVCLCRREMQLAAKPSEIFVNKERHDGVFTKEMLKNPRDIIWAFNAHKAVKRGLQKYLSQPTLDNAQTHSIFKKAIVCQSMYYIAMMYLYQRKQDVAAEFIHNLNKKAAPTLVDEAEACFRSVVRKTKEFYLGESKNLDVDVSWTKMEGFLVNLCSQIGLDFEGAMPFTDKTVVWQDDEPAEA